MIDALDAVMSPAAIGWSVVRLRGMALASKRSPIAFSIRSGQPRPLDDETVTTACRRGSGGGLGGGDVLAHRHAHDLRIDRDGDRAGLGRLQRRWPGQRPDAILAGRRRRALAARWPRGSCRARAS